MHIEAAPTESDGAATTIASLILTLGAIIAVLRFKVGMIPVLAGCSILALVYGLATGAI